MAMPLKTPDPAGFPSAYTPPPPHLTALLPDPTPAARQLDGFDRSVRDPQRLALILRLLGPLDGAHCLFLGCGAPSGALPFHLRASGGQWTWAELTTRWTSELRELLGERVEVVLPGRLPFLNRQFHRIVVLDPNLAGSLALPLSHELGRILTPHGRMVSVASNGRPALSIRLLHDRVAARSFAEAPASRVDAPDQRQSLAVSPSEDVPAGLSFADLEAMSRAAGLVPDTRGTCSRFFSEWVEEVRRRRNDGQLGPLGRMVAALDHLIPTTRGATVAVSARKPNPSPVA